MLPGLGTDFCFRFPSVSPCSQQGQQSPHLTGSLYLLTITRSGCLAEMRWSVCISKSQGSLCVSSPRTDSGLCICHLFVWSNLKILSQFLVDHLLHPVVFCFILFFADLLYSLIMWLIVSSQHHIIYVCIYIVSCLFLLWHS